MSKVSDTKERYRFKQKPVWPTCSNCLWFKYKISEEKDWSGRTWIKESELRCTLGHFKVGKSSTCNEHEPKPKDGSVA